jgi:hypothetical protein
VATGARLSRNAEYGRRPLREWQRSQARQEATSPDLCRPGRDS